MIKIYIDTNCYILYAQDKLPQFKNILNLKIGSKLQILYQPNLKKELLRKISVPRKEKTKIKEILRILDYREKPFVLGSSHLGGSDYLSRFSNKKEKPDDLTIQEVKNQVLIRMFSGKSTLRESDKEDIELYSEAIILGCEYFITENIKDFGKANSEKRQRIENLDVRIKPNCKIGTVSEFLEAIEIVDESNEK